MGVKYSDYSVLPSRQEGVFRQCDAEAVFAKRKVSGKICLSKVITKEGQHFLLWQCRREGKKDCYVPVFCDDKPFSKRDIASSNPVNGAEFIYYKGEGYIIRLCQNGRASVRRIQKIVSESVARAFYLGYGIQVEEINLISVQDNVSDEKPLVCWGRTYSKDDDALGALLTVDRRDMKRFFSMNMLEQSFLPIDEGKLVSVRGILYKVKRNNFGLCLEKSPLQLLIKNRKC